MLWSQIIYGHRTASISPNIIRLYGARAAPGRRQEESYDFWSFLDIVRCPAKFRYYLKFHGARTAFGRVMEGKMTSAGHRTAPGRRPAGVCIHQTGTGRFLFKMYILRFQRCPSGHRTVPGWASYDAWQAPGTFINILTNRPMPVRAPVDAHLGTCRCFMSRTATGEKRHDFCRSTYCIYLDISLLKTKNIYETIYISLEQLRMIYMKRTSAIILLAVLSKCSFHHNHCQSQLNFSYFNNLFLGGMMANFDINEFIIARENLC